MANTLQLSNVNFHYEENNNRHNTIGFSKQRLIVRRGEIIRMTMEFKDRNYDEKIDKIVFIAQTGSPEEGPRFMFKLLNFLRKNEWSACIQKESGRELEVSIFPPPTAIIGHYFLKCNFSEGENSVEMGKFILLFNPWCEGDDVFMNKSVHREEYIQSDQGLVFKGTAKDFYSFPWTYGQYEKDILDISLAVLDKSNDCLKNPGKDYWKRGDPVYVSRVLSAMVNSLDDKGIVRGKWSSTFHGGENPSNWNGSTLILQKWYKDGFKAVCYGQCWVYAAVACTVMRCLGIPSRPVTNYNSAHDKTGNLNIDIVVDLDSKIIHDASGDSVWNFHCWTEVWMKRRDLQPKFDGWQVIDGTPQEKSDGMFCLGPTSVNAVKNGHVNEKYDSKMVFSEVNADYITWRMDRNKTLRKIKVDTQLIGKHISTKAVKKDERIDLTNNYKYSEGSEEERQVHSNALFERVTQDDLEKEIFMKVVTPFQCWNGNDIAIETFLSNKTAREKSCKVTIVAHTMIYNGELLSECGRAVNPNLVIAANKGVVLKLKLLYSEYSKMISPELLIMVTAVAVDVNDKAYMAKKVIRLSNPKMKIQIYDEMVQFQKIEVKVNFSNPLPIPLFNCCLQVEGVGKPFCQDIPNSTRKLLPKEEVNMKFTLIPERAGWRKIVFGFVSDRLHNVKTFKNVYIKPVN